MVNGMKYCGETKRYMHGSVFTWNWIELLMGLWQPL